MTVEEQKRGRPREAWSIERDEKVMEILRAEGPMTRNDLADRMGLPPQLVYHALDRLRRGTLANPEGRVRLCVGAGGTLVWSVRDGDAPCP
jgi:predicted transcriptional regulator